MKIELWQFFEYLSFVFSLIYYKGLRAYSLQLMPFFLFYICCSESLASYYVELGMPSTRGFLNVYYFVSAIVFYHFFYIMLRPTGKLRKVYIAVAIVSSVFFVYELFDNDIYVINSLTLVISFLQHVVLSLLLLFKLAFDENSRDSIVKEPYFWIAVGVLIFSLVTIVTMGLQPYIYRNQIKLFGKTAYRIIIPAACVLLYSCYCYAFYLTSRTKHTYGLAVNDLK